MRKSTVRSCTPVAVALAIAGCTGSGSEATPTAPSPTTAPAPSPESNPPSVATPATATTTSTTPPSTTTTPTTTPETTAPPITQPGTTLPAINPTGVPVAVTGKPILTNIPGELIDYVPGVAANLNIDVSGQYYEILPQFYVFIPTQDSKTNPNLQTLSPADLPVVEAYVRAVSALWAAFTMDPAPEAGTAEMNAAFAPDAYEFQKGILQKAADRGSTTTIREGNLSAPRMSEKHTEVDCAWLDQVDVTKDGTTYDDWRMRFGISATFVSGHGGLKASELYKNESACQP